MHIIELPCKLLYVTRVTGCNQRPRRPEGIKSMCFFSGHCLVMFSRRIRVCAHVFFIIILPSSPHSTCGSSQWSHGHEKNTGIQKTCTKLTQQTQMYDIYGALDQRRTVEDVGLALHKYYINVLCLLGTQA